MTNDEIIASVEKHGGPVHPTLIYDEVFRVIGASTGMDERTYAAIAMATGLATSNIHSSSHQVIAMRAVQMADALLAELAK